MAGSAFTMVGLACIPYASSTLAVHVNLTVLALGSGIVIPAGLGLISRHADSHEQGSVLGVNQSLGALGRALGPIWGGYVFQHLGHEWPFLTGGAVMLCVVVLAWRWL